MTTCIGSNRCHMKCTGRGAYKLVASPLAKDCHRCSVCTEWGWLVIQCQCVQPVTAWWLALAVGWPQPPSCFCKSVRIQNCAWLNAQSVGSLRQTQQARNLFRLSQTRTAQSQQLHTFALTTCMDKNIGCNQYWNHKCAKVYNYLGRAHKLYRACNLCRESEIEE